MSNFHDVSFVSCNNARNISLKHIVKQNCTSTFVNAFDLHSAYFLQSDEYLFKPCQTNDLHICHSHIIASTKMAHYWRVDSISDSFLCIQVIYITFNALSAHPIKIYVHDDRWLNFPVLLLYVRMVPFIQPHEMLLKL